MSEAAVSLVVRKIDKRLLCVWNGRYGGWTLPGGKVKEGETTLHAQGRELFEETGLNTLTAVEVYSAETCVKDAPEDRGRMVHVFHVQAWMGTPGETEIGRPVTWLTLEEFLKWSPFAEFYREMFARAFPLPVG